MRGKTLFLGVWLSLLGCAQTGDREPTAEFGSSVRHAIRLQTEFSGPQTFSTDGVMLGNALARYRSGDSAMGGTGSSGGDSAGGGHRERVLPSGGGVGIGSQSGDFYHEVGPNFYLDPQTGTFGFGN